MVEDPGTETNGADLRRRAEAIVEQESADLQALTPDQMLGLVHELRVHQIELEMQNENLRQAQIELELARDRYVDLYDFAPAGYMTLSESGVILDANLTVASMLGVERAQLLGRPMTQFIVAEDQDSYYLHRRRLFATQEPQACQLRLARADGTQPWTQLAASTITDAEGRLVCRMTISDIDDLRTLEQQLHQQEQLAMVGQLAAGFAHDFRNLLTTIVLNAEIALFAPQLPETAARHVDGVVKESARATHLVQQILDFSSRAMMHRRAVDLEVSVRDTVRALRQTTPDNIRVSVKTGPWESIVNADSERMGQVLANLADNARDAMPDGGELQFGLSRLAVTSEAPPVAGMPSGDWVCLSVSDTGTGMTDDVRVHLFEPFFTTKEVGKGTGLGLAQVYGIVRQHEGYIDVSTAVGQGTTFRIYLPARPPSGPESPPQRETPLPRGHGETILLVEDEQPVLDAATGVLTTLGYRVLVAGTGLEAIMVLAAQERIDLVITDIVRPSTGGSILARDLRQRAPNLKVIAITAPLVGRWAQDLREAGFVDVLHKPLESGALARAVRHALDMNQ